MNHSKELLEIWTKTQIRMTESFLETIQRMMESLGKENFLETYTQAYKQWFENQKDIMEDMAESIRKHVGITMPGYFHDIQKSQELLGKQWIDSTKEMMMNYFGLNFAPQERKGFTKENIWAENYKNWLESFSRPFSEFSAGTFGGYNFMMETVKDYMSAFYPHNNKDSEEINSTVNTPSKEKEKTTAVNTSVTRKTKAVNGVTTKE